MTPHSSLPSSLSHSLPDRLPDGFPGYLPRHVPNGLATSLPSGLRRRHPRRLPSGLPHDLPHSLPNGLPNGLPHDIPHSLSNGFPDSSPGGLPGNFRGSLLGDLPGGLPRDLPSDLSSDSSSDLPNIPPDGLSNGAHSNGTHSNGIHVNGVHTNGIHSSGDDSIDQGAPGPAIAPFDGLLSPEQIGRLQEVLINEILPQPNVVADPSPRVLVSLWRRFAREEIARGRRATFAGWRLLERSYRGLLGSIQLGNRAWDAAWQVAINSAGGLEALDRRVLARAFQVVTEYVRGREYPSAPWTSEVANFRGVLSRGIRGDLIRWFEPYLEEDRRAALLEQATVRFQEAPRILADWAVAFHRSR